MKCDKKVCGKRQKESKNFSINKMLENLCRVGGPNAASSTASHGQKNENVI